MRYGIFSDVHGNLPALRAVIKSFAKEEVDAYYCVGDVVGYGADPQACIQLIKDLCAVCVAGNHDWGVTDRTDIRYFNGFAQEAILWTRGHLAREGFDFLNQLELVYESERFSLVHSTLPHPEEFDYLDDLDQVALMFRFMPREICFIGHTHVPGIFIHDQGRSVYLDSSEVMISKGKKYIINVGSVGQPRDGNPLAAYCVYDLDLNTVSIKRTPYDIPEAQRRILDAGLPSFLAGRLSQGE